MKTTFKEINTQTKAEGGRFSPQPLKDCVRVML